MASGQNTPVSLFQMDGTSFWYLETAPNSKKLSVSCKKSTLKSRPEWSRLISQQKRTSILIFTTTLSSKLMTWTSLSFLRMRAVFLWALWAWSQLFTSKRCLMWIYTTLQWCTKCSCLGSYKNVPSWDWKVVWWERQASLKLFPCQDLAWFILLQKRCQAT